MDSVLAKEGRSPFYNVTGRVLMNMLPGKYTFRGVCVCERERERNRETGKILRHFGEGGHRFY